MYKILGYIILITLLAIGIFYGFFFQPPAEKKDLKDQVIDVVAAYAHECLVGELTERSLTIVDYQLSDDFKITKGRLFFDEDCRVKLAVYADGFCVVKDYQEPYSVSESSLSACTREMVDDCLDGEAFAFSDGRINDFLLTDEKEVCIPDEINNEPVRAIGSEVFANLDLTKVYLPDTIEQIEAGAFINNNLSRLDLPAELNYIGSMAFANNELNRVTIPASVAEIGNGAFTLPFEQITWEEHDWDDYWFYHNNVLIGAISHPPVLEIPEAARVIGQAAFADTAIEQLVIPKTLITIRDGAFANSAITEIVIASDDLTIGSDNFADELLALYEENGAGRYVQDEDGTWGYQTR